MRSLAFGIMVALLGLALVSCDEAVKPAYAYGEFSCSNCSDISFDGNLDKKSAELYGTCEESDGSFKFEVGDDDKEHVEGASEGYIYVRGIVGPPTEGTFDSLGQPKDEESLITQFEYATIKNTNTYNVASSDGNDLCEVELFSTAAEGELVPANNKSFEYYVRINCSGINVDASQGQGTITNFRAEFYFDNCK